MSQKEPWIGWAAVRRGERPALYCYDPACVAAMRSSFRKFECREFLRADIVADRDQECRGCGKVLWKYRMLEFGDPTPPFSEGEREQLFESGRARGYEIEHNPKRGRRPPSPGKLIPCDICASMLYESTLRMCCRCTRRACELKCATACPYCSRCICNDCAANVAIRDDPRPGGFPARMLLCPDCYDEGRHCSRRNPLPKPLSRKTIEKIKKLAESGMNAHQISLRLGIAPQTASKWMVVGPEYTPALKVGQKIPKSLEREIHRMHQSGMSQTDISRSLKITRVTVGRVLERKYQDPSVTGPGIPDQDFYGGEYLANPCRSCPCCKLLYQVAHMLPCGSCARIVCRRCTNEDLLCVDCSPRGRRR